MRDWVRRRKGRRERWVCGERSGKERGRECGNRGTRGELGATVSPCGVFGVQDALVRPSVCFLWKPWMPGKIAWRPPPSFPALSPEVRGHCLLRKERRRPPSSAGSPRNEKAEDPWSQPWLCHQQTVLTTLCDLGQVTTFLWASHFPSV